MSKKENTAVIGIDLGGTKVSAGLVYNNKILYKQYQLLPQNETDPWKIISLIISLIKNILEQTKAQGIGIGVPSIVDRQKGIVYEVHNIPSWKEVHLSEILSSEFKIPVFLDNDANCFALGEYYFGIGQGHRNMVGVTIGTGMGAGIITGGYLMDDAHGGSGEFGMIPYQQGVIEDYCSGKFFRKFYNTKGEEMMLKAQNNDPVALEAFERFGQHLGNAIKIIMYAVDPELIVIGGSIAKSSKFFDSSMRQTIKSFEFKKILENIKITYSTTNDISILGAAALFFDRMK